MGIALLVFMGLAVVAIDFGHLGLSTNEVQIVADTAATAGARALMRNDQGRAEDPVAVAQAVVAENHLDDGAAFIAGVRRRGRHVRLGDGDLQPGRRDPECRACHRPRDRLQHDRGHLRRSHDRRDARRHRRLRGQCQRGARVPGHDRRSASSTQYQTNENCSDLPLLNQVPSANDTSGWTSLGPASASASGAISYLPEACGGGGQAPPRSALAT